MSLWNRFRRRDEELSDEIRAHLAASFIPAIRAALLEPSGAIRQE